MSSVFNVPSDKHRLFGLDFLRAAAVLFVVFGHSLILVPDSYKEFLRMFVLDGVSVFFVLSGFLIGGILIRQLEKNEPTVKLLVNFWKRRWLRTLPMYYVTLILLLGFYTYYKPEAIPDNIELYFVFLQNFNTPQPNFFSESWSLCVEEWFYLLVPLLLFGILRWFKVSLRIALIILFLIICVSVTVNRWIHFDKAEIATVSDSMYFLTQVTMRLDAIVYGFIAAFIARFYEVFWRKMAHPLFVVLGFVLMYQIKFRLDEEQTVWIPVFKSLCIMIMLPFLSQWNIKKNILTKGITLISKISYSMYLVNLNIVLYIGVKFLVNGNLFSVHQPGEYWVMEYLFFWTGTFILAYFFYRVIEIPFMNLRKREL